MGLHVRYIFCSSFHDMSRKQRVQNIHGQRKKPASLTHAISINKLFTLLIVSSSYVNKSKNFIAPCSVENF